MLLTDKIDTYNINKKVLVRSLLLIFHLKIPQFCNIYL